MAEESREGVQRASRLPVLTEITLFSAFYLAEAYHQKYYLRGASYLMKEFRAIYPSDSDFINSTAAARVNGCVGGYGTSNCLESEPGSLGLSPMGQKLLVQIVHVQSDQRVRI